jgi:hypothetical protein
VNKKRVFLDKNAKNKPKTAKNSQKQPPQSFDSHKEHKNEKEWAAPL